MEQKDCPYRVGIPDSIDRCGATDNLSPCIYETGDGPCEILEEIEEEMGND